MRSLQALIKVLVAYFDEYGNESMTVAGMVLACREADRIAEEDAMQVVIQPMPQQGKE